MNVNKVSLRNFRRLEDVSIDFDRKETVFVGPNNSGKTSATTAFKLFLKTNDFKIHDFSVSKIVEFDKFGELDELDEIQSQELPTIEMDLWFLVNDDLDYATIRELVHDIFSDFNKVGIRLKYQVKNKKDLLKEYSLTFPKNADKNRQKSLSYFLSMPGNLNRHFEIEYSKLAEEENNIVSSLMRTEDAKNCLKKMIRIDFVDAQRNIDDHEQTGSTRLSSTFSSFYKKNLTQAEILQDANAVIDQNNDLLTAHYETQFQDLFSVIQDLGVPSINDRRLKLVSSLSPEEALKGNTLLLYVDPHMQHELPEAYNGLGFKNLVYIAIQISHFHTQWINTTEKRPYCQIIFIEEPEAHLHSQVQQTFIANIWEILRRTAKKAEEPNKVPQLVISTHSSHIIDKIDFSRVRYFKRCKIKNLSIEQITLNATEVKNLAAFVPDKTSASHEKENPEETLGFLKKYMKLTHCDLFFSDATILVEGTVEKLLLPEMINKSTPDLNRVYLTILEVGGAYSHRFASLLKFLGMPYLIITDIDSVDPNSNRSSCRADTIQAVTSNASINFFIGETQISNLSLLPNEKKSIDGLGFITFQQPVATPLYGANAMLHGRTLEEAFIYENIDLLKDKTIDVDVKLNWDKEHDYQKVYEFINSRSFKKTEFALNVLTKTSQWKTPAYITVGLEWLTDKTGRAPEQENKK